MANREYQGRGSVVRYRFFHRDGGVSRGRFAGLNLSYQVGDDRSAVNENRRRVKEAMTASRLISGRQVHGDRIYLVDGGEAGDVEVDGYDALITTQPGTALLVQQADCQAVLLHDPVRHAVAAIHCGWRGSVAGLIGKTMEMMRTELQTDPGQCEAFIGPSLGPCCAEFVNYRRELPPPFWRFQPRPLYFDFWQISTWQLVTAGLPADKVRVSRVCTSCSTEYFSYRRSCRNGSGATGRHGSAICL
ncbi:MAG: laccase domain-containing protein [Desulfofustis sp.]|nr:laccase domain-containing protein [Desulfofustis sp.]